MKKTIFLLTTIMVVIAGCTEDKDKWSDVMRDMDVGGAIPYLKFFTPKLFDITDLDNSKMQFTLDVGASGQGNDYVKVKLYKSYLGGEEVMHAEYANSQIPAEITISTDEALTGLPGGITKDSLNGGDFIDWRWEMEFPDGSSGEYNVDAAATFPDFRSYVGSSPDFDISGTYVTNILVDEVGLASQGATITVGKVGGTADSQYLLSTGDAETVLNWFGFIMPHKVIYVGDNTFNLFPRAEDWLGDFFGFDGTIKRDPSSGVLTFDALWDESFGGISGLRLQYELIPQ